MAADEVEENKTYASDKFVGIVSVGAARPPPTGTGKMLASAKLDDGSEVTLQGAPHRLVLTALPCSECHSYLATLRFLGGRLSCPWDPLPS